MENLTDFFFCRSRNQISGEKPFFCVLNFNLSETNEISKLTVYTNQKSITLKILPFVRHSLGYKIDFIKSFFTMMKNLMCMHVDLRVDV